LRKKEKKDTEYHGYIKGELHVAEESFYEKIRIPLIQSAILILIVFLGYFVYFISNRNNQVSINNVVKDKKEELLKLRAGMRDYNYYRVKNDGVLLYSEANTSSRVLARLNKNSLIKNIKGNNEWIQVLYNDVNGFVKEDDISWIGLHFDVLDNPYLTAEISKIRDELNKVNTGRGEIFSCLDYYGNSLELSLFTSLWEKLKLPIKEKIINRLNLVMDSINKEGKIYIKSIIIYDFAGNIILKI
ncbi:MAG: hypothetical protein AB1765_09975, partial [Candidatus Hydrogenedentota bacterium]